MGSCHGPAPRGSCDTSFWSKFFRESSIICLLFLCPRALLFRWLLTQECRINDTRMNDTYKRNNTGVHSSGRGFIWLQSLFALVDCWWHPGKMPMLRDRWEVTWRTYGVSLFAAKSCILTIVPRPSKEEKKKDNSHHLESPNVFSICQVILKTTMQFHKGKALTIAFYKIRVKPFFFSRLQNFMFWFPWAILFAISLGFELYYNFYGRRDCI